MSNESMTATERLNAAIDLLELARTSERATASRLITQARALYPISRETELMISLCAFPNTRENEMLQTIKSRPERTAHTPNPNKVNAARAAWQKRKLTQEK